MTVPFYKLQLAGNGFILVDLAQIRPDGQTGSDEASNVLSDTTTPGATALESDLFPEAARRLCDRRFGIGASGAIFLSADNTIRIFGAQGQQVTNGDDAILCAARYAFDSGRLTNRTITFRTPLGERKVTVLGAHEFRLNVGSPFSLLNGRVITPNSNGVVETIERDQVRSAYAAIHIHEDVVIAFPEGIGTLNFSGFNALIQKAFPSKQVTPAIARCVTKETILVRTAVKRESGCCAVAAASLVAAFSSGICEKDAVVMFEYAGTDGQPDEAVAKDRDNSRRLAVSWDAAENDLFVTGTGGYLFEGKFDLTF